MEDENGLKTYQIFRASLYDPRVKRQIAKIYNLTKMSLEEARNQGKQWKVNKKKEIDEDLKKIHNDKPIAITDFKVNLTHILVYLS